VLDRVAAYALLGNEKTVTAYEVARVAGIRQLVIVAAGHSCGI